MRPTRFEIFVLLVVLGLTAYLAVPAWQARRAKAMEAACLSNMKAIGAGLADYLEANDATWPYVGKLNSFSRRDDAWPTLRVVLAPVVETDAVFRCPADSRIVEDAALRAKFGADSTWFETEGLSYEWIWPEAYGGRRVGQEKLSRLSGRGKGRADQDLLRDFEAFHVGAGGANTLYADFVARPDSNETE